MDLLDVCVLEKSNICYKSKLLSWDLLSESLCPKNTINPVLEQLNRSSSEDDQQPGGTITVPSVLEYQFTPQAQACCDGNCNGGLMYLPSLPFSLYTPRYPFIRMLKTWCSTVALTHANVTGRLFVLPVVANLARLDSLPSMASTVTVNRCISSGSPSIAKSLGVMKCLHVRST